MLVCVAKLTKLKMLLLVLCVKTTNASLAHSIPQMARFSAVVVLCMYHSLTQARGSQALRWVLAVATKVVSVTPIPPH